MRAHGAAATWLRGSARRIAGAAGLVAVALACGGCVVLRGTGPDARRAEFAAIRATRIAPRADGAGTAADLALLWPELGSGLGAGPGLGAGAAAGALASGATE